jgi:hypothetical protein
MRHQTKPAATHRDAAHASNCHVHRDLPKTDAPILLLEGLETLLRIPMQVQKLAAAKLGLYYDDDSPCVLMGAYLL